MKADIEVADREHQWFKFMLLHHGGRYTRLEHTVYTSQTYIKRDAQGQIIDSKVYTKQIPLNFRVESLFQGEYLCESNEIFHGSDIERCFSPELYPPIQFEEDPPNIDDFKDYESDIPEWDCPCCGRDLGDGREVCICRKGRDLYD